MEPITFEAEIVHWRGPAPFHFAPLPKEHAARIRAVAKFVTYGWGVVPVTARIGAVGFTTALFPRDGTYLLPLKQAVRRRLGVTVGDRIAVALTLGAS